jgi:lipopolysaccharide export system protein LptC
MARDNLHSRLVAILKIVLPLAALAVLSSLFLFSGGIRPEDAIPYASVDVEDRLREPRMTDAGLSGVTADGAAITLSAAEAVPAPADGGATAMGIRGKLVTPDGASTEIVAVQAQMASGGKAVALTGGVELRSSAGYVVEAEGFDLALDRTWLASRGQVAVQAPMGQLTADAMRLDRQGGTGPYLLVFNGGVRLIYDPQK